VRRRKRVTSHFSEDAQNARDGSFGFNTLRALSAPATGNPTGLSSPTCTSTLA
jgi:hypothetical protein